MGYLIDIPALQDLHLPPRTIKLTIGMLSHGLIGLLQEGHLEEGMIIDNLLGILYIQTLRNEPATRPKRKTAMYRIISCIMPQRILASAFRFKSSITKLLTLSLRAPITVGAWQSSEILRFTQNDPSGQIAEPVPSQC